MKYCSNCGHTLDIRIPEGDNRPRSYCPQCGTIHYVNPKIVVGTIPVYQGQVLLCKRAIEPRYGYWTLPAGFMELAETTHEGALRETWEEAGAKAELGPLFTMLDVKRADQVHLFFRANLPSPDYSAGEESLDVQLFDEADIPWQDLAFKTVETTLKLFFKDRSQGQFSLHTGDVFEPVSWPAESFKPQ